jgi:hypothetical protein
LSRLLRLRRESVGFAIGSLMFAVGACPGYLGLVGEDWTNATFFAGSIFFTAAAFIQLRLTGRWQRGAWKSKQDWDDWWSAASQFIGTLFFNFSTLSALIAGIGAAAAAGHVWLPDAFGSVLFLVSSGLAIAATRHAGQLWDPDVRGWWSTWLNMAGSVAFGISAIAAYVVPATGEPVSTQWTNLGTFIGALCFMVAALLVKPPRKAIHGDETD